MNVYSVQFTAEDNFVYLVVTATNLLDCVNLVNMYKKTKDIHIENVQAVGDDIWEDDYHKIIKVNTQERGVFSSVIRYEGEDEWV